MIILRVALTPAVEATRFIQVKNLKVIIGLLLMCPSLLDLIVKLHITYEIRVIKYQQFTLNI